MELKDLKFKTIVARFQELKRQLPRDAEIFNYKFTFYAYSLPTITWDFWAKDYSDIIEEIRNRMYIWKDYPMCGIAFYANRKSKPFIRIKLELDFELFQHKEIKTTSETVYNLKREPSEFTGTTPSKLIIRNRDSKLIDLEAYTWREVLKRFICYLYVEERKQYNALLRNPNSKLYKISTKEITIPCDGKKRNRYFKINDRFFYINYSASKVIQILKDTIMYLKWLPGDVGIKLDYLGKEKTKSECPKTQYVKTGTEAIKAENKKKTK